MNPSLRDQLKDWKKKHQESTPKKPKNKKPSQKPKKAKSEKFCESDIRSLMGMNQRGLRRGKGGAWR
ncbi:hypothetical protein [Peribacillus tepidiphilus]|uniref:hypothetical protein n=1 Tax=Peribacillus tepidiphilus TaxID=2652445 RepID=UPI0035B54930